MTKPAYAVSAAILLGFQIAHAGSSKAQTLQKRFFTIAAVEPRGARMSGRRRFRRRPFLLEAAM